MSSSRVSQSGEEARKREKKEKDKDGEKKEKHRHLSKQDSSLKPGSDQVRTIEKPSLYLSPG